MSHCDSFSCCFIIDMCLIFFAKEQSDNFTVHSECLKHASYKGRVFDGISKELWIDNVDDI